MIKLHLGCGKRNFPGFINVDLADFPHIHHRRAVDDLSPIATVSVELIYASHVFEYFSLTEVPRVLAEWRRVLKPGGILKLAVPDFTALVLAYQRFGDLRLLQGVIYGLIEPGTMQDLTLFHKVIYDFKLLKKVLEENGFTKVQTYNWQNFLEPGQEDHSAAYLPSHDYKNGILVSLNVQAEKCGALENIASQIKHQSANFAGRVIKKVNKYL